MIIIIDFGGQTAHLIGRRLRQLGVKSDYTNPEDALKMIKELKPSGIILSGGPASVYEPGAPTVNKKIFSLNIPVLGICYGWQLMAHLLNGHVKSARKEYGPEQLVLKTSKSIFTLPEKKYSVIMSHGDTVTKLPAGFATVGRTQQVDYAA